MSIKQIADRLEAWADSISTEQLKDILADLRALEGKTVLPAEIEECLYHGDAVIIELKDVEDTQESACYLAYIDDPGIVCGALTPAAAIDALAEEIRKEKT